MAKLEDLASSVGCRNDDCSFDGKTQVVQTGVVQHDGKEFIWRRRRCPLCLSTYKTAEIALDDATTLLPPPIKGLW